MSPRALAFALVLFFASVAWGDVEIVAVGDFGTDRGGANREVAAALEDWMASRDRIPDHVVVLGDNFYPDGLIGAGRRCGDGGSAGAGAFRRQVEAVVAPWEVLRGQVPVHVLPGNHDRHCPAEGSWANQARIDDWLPPGRRWGGGWRTLRGTVDRLAGGDGFVLVGIDSTTWIDDPDELDRGVRRLRAILASEPRAWRIVAAHHPIQATGAHAGRTARGRVAKAAYPFVRALGQADELYGRNALYEQEVARYAGRLAAVFREHPVDLFLAGHEHALEILAPDDGGHPVTVISGAGARCQPVTSVRETIFGASRYGFVRIGVGENELAVEVVTTAPPGPEPCRLRAPDSGRWTLAKRWVMRSRPASEE